MDTPKSRAYVRQLNQDSDLGREVAHGPDAALHSVSYTLRVAEVTKSDSATRGQEQILALHIPVKYALLVDVLKSRKHFRKPSHNG